MITLTDSARARADRDFFHAAGLAELAKPDPDVLLAAHLFAAAGAHARPTCRQLQQQVGLAFAGLPRANPVTATAWEAPR